MLKVVVLANEHSFDGGSVVEIWKAAANAEGVVGELFQNNLVNPSIKRTPYTLLHHLG